MLTPSLPSEAASGVPVGAWRRLDAGLFARAADGTPRTGILSMTSDDLVTGTTDLAMTYRIGPFVAVTARGTGVERIANDASETIGTDAAPQANSRIDVIWVRATFVLDGDTAPTTTFGVSKGVANQNPQKPTIPAGALELATAEVKSSDLATQTVLITPTWRYTAAAGGVVRLRNKAEMDAWAPANGAHAWRIDEGTEYVRVGGIWSPIAGVMPRISLVPSTTQTVNNDFGVSNWAPPGTSGSDQALGTDWFEYVNANGIGNIRVKRAGRYRVCVRMAVQNANDQAIAAYLIANGDKTTPVTQDTVRTHPTYGTTLKLDVPSIALAAGATLGLYIPAASAALSIGGSGRGSGQFDVQYIAAS